MFRDRDYSESFLKGARISQLCLDSNSLEKALMLYGMSVLPVFQAQTYLNGLVLPQARSSSEEFKRHSKCSERKTCRNNWKARTEGLGCAYQVLLACTPGYCDSTVCVVQTCSDPVSGCIMTKEKFHITIASKDCFWVRNRASQAWYWDGNSKRRIAESWWDDLCFATWCWRTLKNLFQTIWFTFFARNRRNWKSSVCRDTIPFWYLQRFPSMLWELK